MKYTRIKRYVFAILKEHSGEKTLAEIVITDKVFTPLMGENTFWYLLDNEHKIYEELFKEGKIRKPKMYGEWIKDLI